MIDNRTHYKKHSMDGESYIQKHWREAAAIVYLAICVFDFILAPILLGWYSIYTKQKMDMWIPLTTQGAGILHISFGAILGTYAYGRSQEVLQCNNLNAQYYNKPPEVQNTTVVNNEYDVSQYKKT